MAKKIFTDESLTTLVDEIKAYTDAVDSKKVDKVSGKGLSTNDYTTAEKNKLSGIATGAEVNQNAFGAITVNNDSLNYAQSEQSGLNFVSDTLNLELNPSSVGEYEISINVGSASTSTKGIVQLTNSTSSTSTTTAATPSSVKSAYDLANTANTKITTLQTDVDQLASETTYFNEEGTVGIVGEFTNQIPISTDLDGSIYNGIGYKNGYRWSSSGKKETADAEAGITGYMPYNSGNTLRIKNIALDVTYPYIILFDSTKTVIKTLSNFGVLDSSGVYTTTIIEENVAFIRITAKAMDSSAIVTVNQNIIGGSFNTGWLKNYEDEQIAPNTFASQIFNDDGSSYADTVEDKIQEVIDNLSSHTHKYAGSSSVGGSANSAVTLDGLTATVTELNHMDGVTSNVQTQLDNKANKDELSDLVDTELADEVTGDDPTINPAITNLIDSLTAEDVGARPDTWTPTASDVGAVPTSRTVNGKSLSSDITLSASDVGAAAASHGTHVSYGTSASALGTSSAGNATTVSRSDHVHALPALTSCTGTLTVAKGGTGVTSITSGNALIGAGTGAITSRAITNNTSNTATLTRNTNLVTANTVSYFLNRTSALASDNTGYTTYCARAIALTTSVPSSVTNGTIAFVYA